MNQRRSSGPNTGTYVAAVVVVFALVLGLVYWFVIRDDEDGTTNPGASTSEPKTFTSPASLFTFQYPETFVEIDSAEDRGYVWLAGIGPYDFLNVKRLKNEPTSLGRLKEEGRTAFKDGFTILGEGKETRDGVEMVTFTVESKVGELTVRSQLYLFSIGGVTWQIECESQAKATEVGTACAQALTTFTAA